MGHVYGQRIKFVDKIFGVYLSLAVLDGPVTWNQRLILHVYTYKANSPLMLYPRTIILKFDLKIFY
jgi:hypothetical protein